MMDGTQFRAIGSVDVLYLIVAEVIDISRVAEVIVLNHINVSIDVVVECTIGIVAVLVVVGTAVIEVRCPCVCQCLFCMIFNRLQLIAVAGDDEAVDLAILVEIVHTVTLNDGDVVPFGHVREKAVLVVPYMFDVAVGGIDADGAEEIAGSINDWF